MRKSIVAATAALAWVGVQASAAPPYQRPADTAAQRTAMMQQKITVAALACKVAGALALSHQKALPASDTTLVAMLIAANSADRNRLKTELADNASLRSLRDALFCALVAAKFEATVVRAPKQMLAMPAGTGVVTRREPPQTVKVAAANR